MSDDVTEEDLVSISRRVDAVRAVAPPAWEEFLETRMGVGGGSFIRFDAASDRDQEIHLSVHYDNHPVIGPDVRVDAIIDFIAHACEDVPRLLEEVRRLKDREAG